MNTIAKELISIARDIIAAGTPFKDVPVGGIFHNGLSKGIGADSGETHVTFFQKADKSSAKIVKSDWAPRQMGSVERFTAFASVFPVDKLPTHDTRKGL